jgi:hypothetical protein
VRLGVEPAQSGRNDVLDVGFHPTDACQNAVTGTRSWRTNWMVSGAAGK